MISSLLPGLLGVVDNVGQASVSIHQISAFFPVLSVCGAGIAASIPSWLRRRKKN